MREDVVEKTLTAEQALDQAPAVEEQRFVVPQIPGGVNHERKQVLGRR